MPLLLNRMPFLPESGEIVVRGERVLIRADQIVVWVSLSHRSRKEPDSAANAFPAILDTGHNHTFSIHERHLSHWAGLSNHRLESRGSVRDRGQQIALRLVNLWIHPNQRGKRDELADVAPFRLDAKLGIAVYPGGDFPRLPLLGLRAISENGLVLNVSGPRREATLRTPRWWADW